MSGKCTIVIMNCKLAKPKDLEDNNTDYLTGMTLPAVSGGNRIYHYVTSLNRVMW